MADIDVVRDPGNGPEGGRKGAGLPGRLAGHRRSTWPWLLPLLLLAVGAFWFLNRDRVEGLRGAVGTTGRNTSDTIRDVGAVGSAPANRRVEIENATVTSVPGDLTFWITDASGARALVLIQERGGEQQLRIREGQHLSVRGSIARAAGVSVTDQGDRQALQRTEMFIRADRVSQSAR